MKGPVMRRTPSDYLYHGPWCYIGDAHPRGTVTLFTPVIAKNGDYLFVLHNEEMHYLPCRTIVHRDALDAYHREGNYP